MQLSNLVLPLDPAVAASASPLSAGVAAAADATPGIFNRLLADAEAVSGPDAATLQAAAGGIAGSTTPVADQPLPFPFVPCDGSLPVASKSDRSPEGDTASAQAQVAALLGLGLLPETPVTDDALHDCVVPESTPQESAVVESPSVVPPGGSGPVMTVPRDQPPISESATTPPTAPRGERASLATPSIQPGLATSPVVEVVPQPATRPAPQSSVRTAAPSRPLPKESCAASGIEPVTAQPDAQASPATASRSEETRPSGQTKRSAPPTAGFFSPATPPANATANFPAAAAEPVSAAPIPGPPPPAPVASSPAETPRVARSWSAGAARMAAMERSATAAVPSTPDSLPATSDEAPVSTPASGRPDSDASATLPPAVSQTFADESTPVSDPRALLLPPRVSNASVSVPQPDESSSEEKSELVTAIAVEGDSSSSEAPASRTSARGNRISDTSRPAASFAGEPASPARAVAKFADHTDTSDENAFAREKQPEKHSLATVDKPVTSDANLVGINAAKPESLMPATAYPAHSPLPAVERSSSAVPVHFNSLNADAGTFPESEVAQAARRSVESVLDVTRHFSTGDHRAVTLQFSVSGVDLGVRVEMRGDAVHTTFRTDSPELRSALAQEWQAVAAGQGSDRSSRLADPVFTSTNSPAPSGTDSGAANQREPQARQQQLFSEAGLAPRAIPRHRPPPMTPPPTARATALSAPGRLHTFA